MSPTINEFLDFITGPPKHAGTYYKVLDGQASFYGGTATWEPNVWQPRIPADELVPCMKGYHLCRNASDLMAWLGPDIWIAEARGEIIESDTKVIVEQARITTRVPAWDGYTLLLFLSDCITIALSSPSLKPRPLTGTAIATTDAAHANHVQQREMLLRVYNYLHAVRAAVRVARIAAGGRARATQPTQHSEGQGWTDHAFTEASLAGLRWDELVYHFPDSYPPMNFSVSDATPPLPPPRPVYPAAYGKLFTALSAFNNLVHTLPHAPNARAIASCASAVTTYAAYAAYSGDTANENYMLQQHFTKRLEDYLATPAGYVPPPLPVSLA